MPNLGGIPPVVSPETILVSAETDALACKDGSV